MNLTKLALLTFLLGLALLFILSSSIEPRLVKISEISSRMIDNYVKISGEVVKVKQTDSLSLLTVNDGTGNMTVVSPTTNLSKGSSVAVIGKVKDYKGSLEIEAEKIQIIS